MNGIIWLASYPKSGNTWLRAFLLNYIEDSSEPVDINSLGRIPVASTHRLHDEYAGVEVGHLTQEEIDQFRPNLYRYYSRANDTLEVGGHKILKIHDAFTYLSSGQPLFPLEATRGVIYILRNPLDVAVSLAHHNISTIDDAINAMANSHMAMCPERDRQRRQLRQELKSWSGHVNSWTLVPNLPFLLIRYEDMVYDNLNTFNAVIRFIGLEEDSERLQHAIEHSSFDVLKTQEEENGFRERFSNSFFRRGKVGNWREHLTVEQAIRLVSNHREVMTRYDYLTSSGDIVF